MLHYLDNFLEFGKEGREAGQPVQRALDCCSQLGVSIAAHKTEGPATKITFLGIELDTVAAWNLAPTGRETTAPAAAGAGVEGQAMLHKERPTVIDRTSPTCHLCSPTW